MQTYNIFQDSKLVKTFENQDGDINVFGWMLRNQSQSIHWALKWGGWKIEYTTDGETYFNYNDDTVISNPLSKK